MQARIPPIKLIMLGESGVGKSTIMVKFAQDGCFSEYDPSLGLDAEKGFVKVGDFLYPVHVWDTAGLEKFNSLGKAYYRGAEGCILVVDMTERESIRRLGYWIKEFRENSGVEDSINVPVIVMVNKSDLKHKAELSEEDILSCDLEFHRNVRVVLTSAILGEGIEESFSWMILEALERRRQRNKCGTSHSSLAALEAKHHKIKCCAL